MPKPKRNKRDIQAEIDNLRAQMKAAETAEEADLGRMARKAGLFDLDISEKKLREALNEIVARFRGTETGTQAKARIPNTTPAQNDREPGGES